MELFGVNTTQPFKGPHQNRQPETFGAPLSRAKAAMILVHGRGASAESMFPLAEEFAQPDVHYIAPQADGYTWYPYSFLAPIAQNEPGISSGMQALHDIIQHLTENGMPLEKIMLLGFSQGACLASEFMARHPGKYGGLAVLSGGLIGPAINAENYGGSLEGTPVFLGCSDVDSHVPKERIDETEAILSQLNADVTKRIYPGMGHLVNEDEVKFVRGMLSNIIHGNSEA